MISQIYAVYFNNIYFYSRATVYVLGFIHNATVGIPLCIGSKGLRKHGPEMTNTSFYTFG